MNLVDVTHAFGGVPLVYDRADGKYGLPVEGSSFKGTRELQEGLYRLRGEFAHINGWMSAHSILCGGTYPGRGTGAHAIGEAIDLDGIVINIPEPYVMTYGESEYADSKMLQPLKTLIACACRRVFPLVLGDYYNKEHWDHLHVALSYSSGNRPSMEFTHRQSDVKLLQTTLNARRAVRLVVDGLFGPKTREALRTILRVTNMSDAEAFDLLLERVVCGTL